jgi:uncharacterized repeat protein (TIGR03803 family)
LGSVTTPPSVTDLQQANADLEQFAHSASHDLKEPLRNISIFSELLAKETQEFTPRGKGFLQLIRESSKRITLTGGKSGKGVVIKIDPSGHESVLYNFTGGADGSSPYSPVVLGYHGNLYGTTSSGGSANAGVAYKLDSAGTETVLYSFTGGLDGASPYSGLLATPTGVLYGTAYGSGAGVVYELKAVTGMP